MPGEHCQLCDVYLPSQLAIEQHNAGKKHVKLMQIENDRLNLEERSVFVYGFAKDTLSVAHITQYFKLNQMSVDKVIMDFTKTTYAIVEFMEKEPAQKMLAQRKLKINGVGVMVKKREVMRRLQSSPVHEGDDFKMMLGGFVGDVDTQIGTLLSQIGLNDFVERREVCNNLETSLHDALPANLKLELFGSSVTGLGECDSDIDATFISCKPHNQMEVDETPSLFLRSRSHLLTSDPASFMGEGKITESELAALSEGDKIRFLSKMLNHIRKTHHLHISHQTPIIARTCPVLRFVIYNKYRCDISFNNKAAITNSKWLSILTEREPRFVLLCHFIRIWFKYHKLSGTEPHLLNNYSISLILIVFLQISKIIPPVETFVSDFDSLIQYWKRPCAADVTCRQLVKGFFIFLSSIKMNRSIISARLGQVVQIEKNEGEDHPEFVFPLSALNVQDPFVVEHNTTALLTHKGVSLLRNALSHATSVVQKEHWNLADLLQKTAHKNGQSSNSVSPHSEGKGDSSTKFSIIFPEYNVKPVFDNVCANICRVLVAILKFEQVDPDERPERKRKRLAEQTLKKILGFKIKQQNTWQGRRLARREIVREMDGASPWQIEMNVTEKLLQNLTPSRVAECCVELDFVLSVDDMNPSELLVDMRHVDGPPNIFNNLVHFINPFLDKLKLSILQAD